MSPGLKDILYCIGGELGTNKSKVVHHEVLRAIWYIY